MACVDASSASSTDQSAVAFFHFTMSSPLVADGAYKIFNVKYASSGVDLIHGNPLGKISGYVDDDDSIDRKVCTDICVNGKCNLVVVW